MTSGFKRMTQTSAPVGARATLGHPANEIFIVKHVTGWIYENNLRPVDDEDFRAGWDIVDLP